ncbi:hypothetical protein SELMODRAFT_187227 [Selaginella moellendorffii]|uniref:Uncharacterized protein n=1 Tax=Selaginella moellendorffii TaxID=88036 RepID=D8TBY2_SELML|nr:uncharacterized protein LOC9652451 [Selaginella moellendorffii]EFJ05856.1 hypothetical protein SELMODRAFT_187227 [Selaginella moellendorffii]|eukprot:XP_002993108.1 uncharacterized protein LOC9652451 [Selaginella moellendorffii]
MVTGSLTEPLLSSFATDVPSTILSMDAGVHDDCSRQLQMQMVVEPPDINLPFSDEIPSNQWLPSKELESLDVGLAPPLGEDPSSSPLSKGRRWLRRSDTIWGAWFFFNHYFRPAIKDKCQAKLSGEGLLGGDSDKPDLRLDIFLVQHDMENMYMWAFKEKPENALGKMQLRSYMNGHSRFREPQFPFSVEKGFIRSHRMQRKHYRGLSNPQCIHGIEVVRTPNVAFVSEEDRKRWKELTGRDVNFTIPHNAEAFVDWRTVPSPDHELERLGLPLQQTKSPNGSLRKCGGGGGGPLNGTSLNLSTQLSDPGASGLSTNGTMNGNGSSVANNAKRKRKTYSPVRNNTDAESCVPIVTFSGLEELGGGSPQPSWYSSFSGVITQASGPVTGAKTIYEDDEGYLIMVSLPFTDKHRLRVSWRNTATHGVVKIHCLSTGRAPFVKRGDRTFKLTDLSPEHCPPGEFLREIDLATRIPDNAELKAYYVEAIAGLEIMVPKHMFSEEREVLVLLPGSQVGHTDS